jgi:hypothetical protein
VIDFQLLCNSKYFGLWKIYIKMTAGRGGELAGRGVKLAGRGVKLAGRGVKLAGRAVAAKGGRDKSGAERGVGLGEGAWLYGLVWKGGSGVG